MHPHVHLVVKAEHEYERHKAQSAQGRPAALARAVCRNLTELGVAATATRREDRGLVKTNKKTPIYRAAHRKPKNPGTFEQPATLTTAAGDSVFMRRKIEAVKRELRTTETVQDRDGYRSLMNVRAKVNERYGEAIHWLRQQGREEEARRFELMRRNLPPVRSEQQLIADTLLGKRRQAHDRGNEQGRSP